MRGVPALGPGDPLPDPRTARQGLVATGGSLTLERLLEAYRKGIFPWSVNPVTWWSPDPRAIFDLDAIHIPRRLRSAVAHPPYRISFDTAFAEVMRACAQRQDEESWITAEFLEAYTALHRAGYAHSIELWRGDQLVAGVYGVALGGLFAGESMFHRARDASKVALLILEQRLKEWGFTLFDTQMLTPVTALLGAREIPREQYLARLERALAVETSPRSFSPSGLS
jgi:leucyl/phenylalanyl-tRNA--protein transferase